VLGGRVSGAPGGRTQRMAADDSQRACRPRVWSSCFGPGCGGRPLPDVLGFGAWQASQLNGGSALWAPMAVVAGVVVLGNIIDGTRGWDKLTRQRVGTTYLHFFLSTFVWAGTAFACWQAGMVPLSPYAPLGLGLLGMLLVYRQTFSNLGLQ
jgi:hypothetical protein